MKNRALPLACAVLPLLLLSGAAIAEDCYVPIANWQSRQAIKDFVATKNWKLRRIKIDDGCYEIYGWDQNGNEIEVKLMPDTLEIIKFEGPHEEKNDEEESED